MYSTHYKCTHIILIIITTIISYVIVVAWTNA